MSWYAAHLIMYFKRRKGTQAKFLVWENIVIFQANSSEAAYEKAEKRGREEELVDDETLTLGGHPVRMVFAGVRKVTECQDESARPTSGSEITYNEMMLRSEDAIGKLVQGNETSVEMLSPFAENDTPESAELAVTANGHGRRAVRSR